MPLWKMRISNWRRRYVDSVLVLYAFLWCHSFHSPTKSMSSFSKSIPQQFNFQHSELQSKKEKLARLEDKRINEATSRNGSVSAAREMLRRLRDNNSSSSKSNNDTTTMSSSSSWTVYATLSSEEMKKRLQHIMDMDGDEGPLLRSLPELIQIRKDEKMEEAKDIEMKNASMRRIIAGYQNLLGVESSTMMGGEGTTTYGQEEEGSLVLQQ